MWMYENILFILFKFNRHIDTCVVAFILLIQMVETKKQMNLAVWNKWDIFI